MATYSIANQKVIGGRGELLNLAVKVTCNITLKASGKSDKTFYHEIENAGTPLSQEFVIDSMQKLADEYDESETETQPTFVEETSI